MSLCYGRPATSIEVPVRLLDGTLATNYTERLWLLSNLTFYALNPRSMVLEDQEQLRECIQHIENLQTMSESVGDASWTSKLRIEQNSFKLYSSFVISFICQQRLRSQQNTVHEAEEQTEWSQKLLNSLNDSIISFVDLNRTSLLPMRIWSMKHIALCSAFLLSLRCNLKTSPVFLQSVEALIDAFRFALEDGPENFHGGLSMPHARALGVLREVRNRNVQQRQQESSFQPQSMDGSTLDVSSGADFQHGFPHTDGPFDGSAPDIDLASSFWDDEFFSLLTGNANLGSNEFLDRFRMDTTS